MKTTVLMDEREFIRMRMEMILEDRRQQRIELEQLQNRLKELDANQPLAPATHQLTRLTDRIAESFSQLEPTLDLVRELLEKVAPNLTLEQALELRQKDAKAWESLIEETTETTTTVTTKREFMSAKEEHESVKTIRKPRHDLKKESRVVVSILKERGTPMNTADLRQRLQEDHGIEYDNISLVLRKMSDMYEPGIERVLRGVYQFNTGKSRI